MVSILFDITANDVRPLGDTDARLLVGKLCEAEIHAQGLSAAGLVFGGDQNAPDGGSDVRVQLPIAKFHPGFIPRANTVFQVKAEPMPPSRIRPEMRPRGNLRPLYEELSTEDGAYVLVSTRDNVTASGLDKRLKAMAAALKPEHATVQLDFYDASRTATWVNRYPGVALWVRQQIGRPLFGWSPFMAWSASDQPVEAEFLLDDTARLCGSSDKAPLPIGEGIDVMRAALRQPRTAIRLVGLSGVGKTRLAQALFDQRVGTAPLSPSIAVYGDVGRGVETPPRTVAEQLVALAHPAVLVVDNCPGDVHRSLVDVIRRSGSQVSLLTIEFDVGEDDFEATVEFRLERASDELVQRLLQQRGFDLSEVDRRRIAEFAGGNARMGLALARAAPTRGSLASLNDGELLDRLFGRAAGRDMRKAADAASLVVSFDLDAREGPHAEARHLSALAGLGEEAFHWSIAALEACELVQRRGPWRAVLPQGLAAKLARTTLLHLRADTIWKTFVVDAPARLLVSFVHRLGLLHDCQAAVALVQRMLAPDGPLADVAALNDLGVKALNYAAPAAPTAALMALERAVGSDAGAEFVSVRNAHRWKLAGLARSLAYEPALFPRAIRVLGAFAAVEPEDSKQNGVGEMFESLFKIVLSGTAAQPEVRFGAIDQLLKEGEIRLGERALRAALQAHLFSSSYRFDFGAWHRGYGWEPRSLKAQRDWFTLALDCLGRLGALDRSAGLRVVADRFQEVWEYGSNQADLIAMTRQLASTAFNAEVWFKVCETLHFTRLKEPTAMRIDLEQLEQELRPATLDDLFNAYVMNPAWRWHDPAGGDHMQSYEESAARARELGAAVATSNSGELERFVPELLSRRDTQAFAFGRGYAAATPDPDGAWRNLRRLVAASKEPHPNRELLSGFVVEMRTRDERQVLRWLDDAVDDTLLGADIVRLQASARLDSAAVDRLIRVLSIGRIPIQSLRWLAGGRLVDDLAAVDLRRLLLAIAAAPEGYRVAIDIFGMRLYSERERPAGVLTEIVTLGRDLLVLCPFDRVTDDGFDYRLGEIADTCLNGAEASSITEQLCIRLKEAVVNRECDPWAYRSVAYAAFRRQVRVALDVFLKDEDEQYWLEPLCCGLSGDDDISERVGIAAADPAICLEWVRQDSATRTARLASVAPYGQKGADGRLEWTQLAWALITEGEHGVAALNCFWRRFLTGGGWGSLQDRLIRRKPLLQPLLDHPNAELSACARTLALRLDEQIAGAARLDDREQTFE